MWLLLGKANLLFDSVREGQIGLSSDHLGFSFGEEIKAFNDVSVDSGIEYIRHIQNQCTTVLQDSFAGRKIQEENAFSDALGSFLPCFVIGSDLNVPTFSKCKPGGLPEEPGIGLSQLGLTDIACVDSCMEEVGVEVQLPPIFHAIISAEFYSEGLLTGQIDWRRDREAIVLNLSDPFDFINRVSEIYSGKQRRFLKVFDVAQFKCIGKLRVQIRISTEEISLIGEGDIRAQIVVHRSSDSFAIAQLKGIFLGEIVSQMGRRK